MVEVQGRHGPVDVEPIAFAVALAGVPAKLGIAQAPGLLGEVTHLSDVETQRGFFGMAVVNVGVGSVVGKVRIGAPAVALFILEKRVIRDLSHCATGTCEGVIKPKRPHRLPGDELKFLVGNGFAHHEVEQSTKLRAIL